MDKQKRTLRGPSYSMNCWSSVWPDLYDNKTCEIFKYQQAQLELGNQRLKDVSFTYKLEKW